MSSSKYHEDIIIEDEESNPIFDSISPERCSHIEDIKEQPSSIENAIYYYVPLLIPPLRYTNYLKRVFEYLSYTLLFDITMPIVQPLNFFILYGLFPAGALVLILLDFAIRVLSFLGIDSSQSSVSEWGDITETDLDGIVRRGTVALGKPFKSLDENKEEQDLVKQIRDFNIDMVETLLFLSSTVYERKEKSVNNAIDQIRKIQYSGANPSTQDVRYLKHQLEESEAAIKAQAEKWGLEFTSISELNSYGGPYAGMFWNVEKNFIVVAFKGTTPTYFSEWLIDFLVQKIDARSYLYGNVHEGFYTTLFPTDDREASKVYRRSPTLRLIEAIRVKAAEIARYNRINKRTDPVSVWVTGHSLGGGLATLFYTRLLKASEVLGENCILRDGFVFASPVVGDDDFAAYFSSQSNKPFEPNKTLWRVVAGNDIVPHIVIGNHNHKVSRYINKIEALNYVHVGEEIQFHFNGSLPSSTRPIFRDNDYFFIGNTLVWSDLKQTLRKSDEIDQPARRKRPVKVNSDKTFYAYERFYPSPFRNHLTHRYFIALEKGRNYFETLDESNDVN